MKQEYIRLTWNGGRTLELKYADYLRNKHYWNKQNCLKERYWA